MRKADQTAWDNLETPNASKNKSSGQSQLDKVAKAQVSSEPVSNSALELEALARGNLSLRGGLVNGRSSSGKIVDAKKLAGTTNLAGVGKSGTLPGGPSNQAATDLVKLARPVFTSGSSDTGATVDIYGTVLNSPQNKIQSVLGDVLGIVNKGLTGILSGELAKATSSMNLISAITDEKVAGNILGQFRSDLLSGVPLTADGMQKTLFNAIGYDGKSLNFLDGVQGMGKSILKDITNAVDNQTGLLTLYKDTEILLKGDYSTADGIFKIISNITSNTKLGGFLDLTNQMKIIGAVTKTLYNLGVPELFEDIYNSLTDSNKKRYVKENITEAFQAGDIDFIEFALKYHSGNWILSNYPNAINMIVSSYQPKTAIDGSVTRAEYVRFVNVLNSIDPHWAIKGTRHGKEMGNLNVFANFNNHARLAFLAGGDRLMVSRMLIAEKYGVVFNTLNELQARYPYYPIKR